MRQPTEKPPPKLTDRLTRRVEDRAFRATESGRRTRTARKRQYYKTKGPQRFTWTPDLIQALVQECTGIHADVFKRVNAAYPYGVRLWDEDTGNTLDARLCKSLHDAIYSARGATLSQRAQRALSKVAIAAEYETNHWRASRLTSATPQRVNRSGKAAAHETGIRGRSWPLRSGCKDRQTFSALWRFFSTFSRRADASRKC